MLSANSEPTLAGARQCAFRKSEWKNLSGDRRLESPKSVRAFAGVAGIELAVHLPPVEEGVNDKGSRSCRQTENIKKGG